MHVIAHTCKQPPQAIALWLAMAKWENGWMEL